MASVPTLGKSRPEIIEGIIDLITSGQVPVASLTSENELAIKLGMSGRSPILREALALLTRDGIVVPRPQRGYEVRRISVEEADEILALRTEAQKLVVKRLAARELRDRLNHAKEIIESLASGLITPSFAVTVRPDDLTSDIAMPDTDGYQLLAMIQAQTLQPLPAVALTAAAAVRSAHPFWKLEREFWCELSRVGGFLTATQTIATWSDQLRIFCFTARRGMEEKESNALIQMLATLITRIEQQDPMSAIELVEEQAQLRLKYIQAITVSGPLLPLEYQEESEERRAVEQSEDLTSH